MNLPNRQSLGLTLGSVSELLLSNERLPQPQRLSVAHLIGSEISRGSPTPQTAWPNAGPRLAKRCSKWPRCDT